MSRYSGKQGPPGGGTWGDYIDRLPGPGGRSGRKRRPSTDEIMEGVFGTNGETPHDRRVRDYHNATSRPEGWQEAGNTTVDGQAGYYEDGGSTGRANHRDRYSRPNGPFGPDPPHDRSDDGGETWERYH